MTKDLIKTTSFFFTFALPIAMSVSSTIKSVIVFIRYFFNVADYDVCDSATFSILCKYQVIQVHFVWREESIHCWIVMLLILF